MNNSVLKDIMKEKGVRNWELAEALGVCEMTLTRKFRKELQEDELLAMLVLVEQIAMEKIK